MAQPTSAGPRQNLVRLPEEIFRKIIQDSIRPDNTCIMLGARKKNQPTGLKILDLEMVLIIARLNWKSRTTLQTLLHGLNRNDFFVHVQSSGPVFRLAGNKVGESFLRTVSEISVDGSAVSLFQSGLQQSTTVPSRGSEIFSRLQMLKIKLSHKEPAVSSPPSSRDVYLFVKNAMDKILRKCQGRGNIQEYLRLSDVAPISQLELAYWQGHILVFRATVRLAKGMSISTDIHSLDWLWGIAYQASSRIVKPEHGHAQLIQR